MEKRTGISNAEFRASEAEGKKYIEGYFVVFNQMTNLNGPIWEEIAPEAIADDPGDVRALFNHNMDLVLGTTGSNTLELKKDDSGLYGKIEVNTEDTDALNAYARVKRGDVKGCSFGFIPTSEEHRSEGDKEVFRVTGLQLFEVSPCVFPAYPQTSINARQEQLEGMKQRELKARLNKVATKLKEMK